MVAVFYHSSCVYLCMNASLWSKQSVRCSVTKFWVNRNDQSKHTNTPHPFRTTRLFGQQRSTWLLRLIRTSWCISFAVAVPTLVIVFGVSDTMIAKLVISLLCERLVYLYAACDSTSTDFWRIAKISTPLPSLELPVWVEETSRWHLDTYVCLLVASPGWAGGLRALWLPSHGLIQSDC